MSLSEDAVPLPPGGSLEGCNLRVKAMTHQNVGSELQEVGRVTEDEYVVEKILDKKLKKDVEVRYEEWYYEVKWKGWSSTFNTWEPLANLSGCKSVLQLFERQWKRSHPGEEKMDVDRVPEAPTTSASGSPTPGPSGRVHNSNVDQNVLPDRPTRLEEEDSDPKMTEFMQRGIEWFWPEGKEPLSMVGCFVKDRLLTYVVKIATDPPIQGLTPENLVLVRGRSFRYLYPQLVIAYYQSSIVHFNTPGTLEDMQAKAAKELARAEELMGNMKPPEEDNFDLGDEDMDEDGLPLPLEERASYQKPSTGLDQFGLPNLGDWDSDSDDGDTFEEAGVDDDDDDEYASDSSDSDEWTDWEDDED